jgi:hypothetical protein
MVPSARLSGQAFGSTVQEPLPEPFPFSFPSEAEVPESLSQATRIQLIAVTNKYINFFIVLLLHSNPR